MARYFTVRAFIDCDDEELSGIKAFVADLGESNDVGLEPERAALYRRGWCFRDADMNWCKHAFYGGSVRADGRELVLTDIARLAALFPDAEGMVVINDDEGEPREFWVIADGRLERAAAAEPQDGRQ